MFGHSGDTEVLRSEDAQTMSAMNSMARKSIRVATCTLMRTFCSPEFSQRHVRPGEEIYSACVFALAFPAAHKFFFLLGS